MRIEDLVRPRRRDGSLAIEGLFTLPVVAVVILLVRFVFEGAMTRHEVSVHTRGSAVAAGAADSTLPAVCRHDSAFITRDGVSKSFRVACDTRDAEAGLRRERPIIEALRRGAGDWPELVDPFEDAMPVHDYRAVGAGATRFDSPPFLTRQGTIATDAAYLSPSLQVFDHSGDPWRSGHDAVIEEELGDGPHRLFPNLFPSK
jgi:hypothetical protein